MTHPRAPSCSARPATASPTNSACPGQTGRIGPPPDLDTDEDYARILTIHIAALAAVDAHLHHESTPTNPAHASAYLLKREHAHWSALHRRKLDPLSTAPDAPHCGSGGQPSPRS
ncbi:hypothetical protein [Streptomyces pluripotens]|uniref:hypothetical protein n=1 Tax=Streptomyces pluripotens TaxID=1355015 RepID=UPI00131C6509|nr:hypothetical protein [Streptomyces pluripotens]